jgi:hypothetical protein
MAIFLNQMLPDCRIANLRHGMLLPCGNLSQPCASRVVKHTPGRGKWLIESEKIIQSGVIATANRRFRNVVATQANPICHALDGIIGAG